MLRRLDVDDLPERAALHSGRDKASIGCMHALRDQRRTRSECVLHLEVHDLSVLNRSGLLNVFTSEEVRVAEER